MARTAAYPLLPDETASAQRWMAARMTLSFIGPSGISAKASGGGGGPLADFQGNQALLLVEFEDLAGGFERVGAQRFATRAHLEVLWRKPERVDQRLLFRIEGNVACHP